MDREPNEAEWDKLMSLMQSIGEGKPYDALAEMVVDALESEEDNLNIHDAVFNLYSFFFRVLCRVNSNPEERPFNIVTEVHTSTDDRIRITNYDYKTYKWAKKICGDYISNDYIDFPVDKLTKQQLTALKSRMENHANA